MTQAKTKGRRPFWRQGIRFECQMSGQCCTSRGEYGFVYLVGDDAERLAALLKLSPSELRAQHCDVTDGHLHLRDPEADCVFLEDGRCAVYTARPVQCSTWPFWVENLASRRVWKRDVATFCPGVGKGQLHTGEEIAEILAREKELDP